MLSFSFSALTDNLEAYYQLDEASGGVIDATGNLADGTNTGATPNVTGKINTAYEFGGSSDNIATGISGNGLTTGTFSAWAKSTDVTAYQVIFGKENATTNNSFDLSINSSKANLKYGNQFLSGTTTLSNNTFYHVVGVSDGTSIYIYLNGSLENSALITGTASSTDNYFIGNRLRSGGDFLGVIDEVGYWDKNIQPTEITELYNSGSGLAYPFTESVTADFNYEIDFETELVSLTDNSSVSSALEITDWNWLKDGNVLSTDQNTSFSITPNNDYNICLTVDTNDVFTDSICKTIEVGGELRLNFYDDDSNTSLDEMYLLLDGVDYYSDSNTFINIDLNGITSGLHSIVLQRTGYQEKSFSLELNEYSDINYNLGFILSSKISNVQFQVFNELGATQPNTTFMAIDNYNGFIIDFKTTDSLGRVTFILNNQKEDYNFYSTDLNFGTTTWTINKPKDAITLTDISGDWKYSITGNSYSSQTNIASGITKLLLQNTVNPYYMSIQDVNESYVETTFGLISITSEKTKTLTPYLYGLDDAELRLIKLYDYATNQPISRQIQLDLGLYTDSNGLIPIGSFINDSTGTYNIYLDSNSNYRLELESEVFELNPSELINVYYIYLQTDIGITEPVIVGDVNMPLNDLNFPTTFFTDVSDYAFGCNINDDANCYAPTVFSLIASVLLLIVFVAFLQTTPIQQTIASGIMLTLFTLISFIPIWVFAITLVIIIAWGLFT